MNDLIKLFKSGTGLYIDFVARAYELGFRLNGRWDSQHHMPALTSLH